MEITNLQAVLKHQYHAGMGMLGEAIERCPETLWTDTGYTNPFWHIVYHTLFYTHLYLQPDEHAFTPWERDIPEYHYLGPLPWPPHRVLHISDPYTKEQLQEYWGLCEAMIDPAVDLLDLTAADCGFSWYSMSKIEHQLSNIRHLQHHTGQLADRVRNVAQSGIEWNYMVSHA